MVVGLLGFLDLGLSLLSSYFHKEREREREMSNNQAKEAEDKISKLQKESNLAINLLDSIPQGAIFLYFQAHPSRFLV